MRLPPALDQLLGRQTFLTGVLHDPGDPALEPTALQCVASTPYSTFCVHETLTRPGHSWEVCLAEMDEARNKAMRDRVVAVAQMASWPVS